MGVAGWWGLGVPHNEEAGGSSRAWRGDKTTGFQGP